jgi:glutathione S-transferase
VLPRLHDYAASANCYKVRLLLARLEREYERVPVDIFAGETLTPEFAARNPGLTTPVLEYAPGAYLPESGAILLYLAEGTDYLPDPGPARAQVHRWMFFEQANVLSILGALRFRTATGRLNPDGAEAQRLRGISTAIVTTVDGHLAGREWVATDRCTVADLALYGYLHVAGEAGVDVSPFANLAAWLDRVRSDPRHVADLEPYPPNAQAGASQSLYDALGV